MKRNLIILTLAASSLWMPAIAKQSNVLDLKESITDESIIFPESFEVDAQKMLESWYLKNYTDTDDRYRTSTNPSTSDATMRQRLADLPTVIDMPYNQIVRSYIDRYLEKGRPQVAALLGLSTYYMPIFESALEAEQLPQELKYLPVIESALDPNAVSRSGAAGLWQFVPATAKGYDLEVSSLVDERRDPYKSSQKAAKMLRDLYESYGDWSLAIAAYNCGATNLNKAIRRAGGDPKKQDFWSVYKYLTPETRGYVPQFIAANYVMNYYREHNISPVLPTKPLVTDTIGISNRVHFDQISNVLNIPKEELRILNPQFRADVIPGSAKQQYMLILPAQQVQAYIMSEQDILAYEAEKYARRIDANPGDQYLENIPEADSNPLLASSPRNDVDDEPAEEEEDDDSANQLPQRPASQMSPSTRSVKHVVGQNETISEIADRYGVRVTDIRSWNSLRRNAVRPGQELTIETSVPESRLQASAPKKQTAPAQPKPKAEPAAPKKEVKREQPAQQQAQTGKNGKQNQQAQNDKTGKNGKQNQQAQNDKTGKNGKQNQQAQNDKTGKNGKQNQQAQNDKTGKNGKQNQQAQNDKTGKNGKQNQQAQNDKTGKNGKQNQQAQNDKTGKNGKQNQQAQNDKTGKNGKQNQQAQNDKNNKGGKSNEHEIKSGESLTTIARQHGVTVDDLMKANNLTSDKIRAGESLKVPKKSAASKNANNKGAKAQPAPAKGGNKNTNAGNKNANSGNKANSKKKK